MKIVFLAGLICALCLISVAKAAPADGDSAEQIAVNNSTTELEQAAEAAENTDDSNRENILTCSLGSAFCFAHCFGMGKWGGGYCSGGTCYCR